MCSDAHKSQLPQLQEAAWLCLYFWFQLHGAWQHAEEEQEEGSDCEEQVHQHMEFFYF